MKKFIFCLCFVNLVSSIEGLKVNPKTVGDFLNLHNLNDAVTFYCEVSPKDWVAAMRKEIKYFAIFDISSKTFKIKDTEAAMQLTVPRLGVNLDLTCNEAGKVLKEFSLLNYFNASYVWLMMSNDHDKATDLLKAQNINWDAEITLAICGDKEPIELFDIYNPNSKTNGKLILKPKGSYKLATGFNITLTGTKYDRRSNLEGAVIHTGLIGHQKNQTLIKYLESK